MRDFGYGDLRGHLLAERELLLPVGGKVDDVLEDGDDDEEVGEALSQSDLSHFAEVEDWKGFISQV